MFGPDAGLDEWPADMATGGKLKAIEHLVEFWEGSADLPHGIRVLEFPGHTPGTTAIEVTSGQEKALFIGDIAHHQAELVEPDFHFIVNMDPEDSAASQKKLLAQFADTGTPIAGAHFANFEWGRVVRRDGGGYDWSPITGSGIGEGTA